MLTAGTASLIAGPFIGKLFDYLNRKKMISLICLVVQLSLMISLLAYI